MAGRLLTGVHEQFISKLENCITSASHINKMKLKSIGFMLRNAKHRRCDADYSLQIDFDSKDAQIQIELVERILSKIEEIKPLL